MSGQVISGVRPTCARDDPNAYLYHACTKLETTVGGAGKSMVIVTTYRVTVGVPGQEAAPAPYVMGYPWGHDAVNCESAVKVVFPPGSQDIATELVFRVVRTLFTQFAHLARGPGQDPPPPP
jgi:hypothetical protein